MTVVVFGAGAVGSLFGARFYASGRPVRLIGRPAHVAAVRAGGLRVEGEGAGTFRCDAAATLDGVGPVELALLTVKTFDLATAAADLGRQLSPLPLLLPQNGLGVERVARSALARAGWSDPAAEVVRAVHSVPATWVGPGVVRAAGTGDVILPDGPEDSPASRFATLFRDAGFAVRRTRTIDEEVWRKVVVNAAINPVTALHRVPNGALAAGPLRREAESLLHEALAVANAEQVPLNAGTALADLDRIVQATAPNRSSMLQDLERGRPTEIDAISGELLRRGSAAGLELPATRAAVARVRAEIDRAAAGATPGDPLGSRRAGPRRPGPTQPS